MNRPDQGSRAYLGMGLAWLALHAFELLGPAGEATFVLLGLGCVLGVVTGLQRHRPTVRWPWLTVLVALLVFVVGGGLRFSLETTGDLTSARSLVPDVVAVFGYLLLIVAVAGMTRARNGRGSSNLDAATDGVIAMLSALVASWVFLVSALVHDRSIPAPIRFFLVLYPAISIAVVLVTARLTFVSAGRRTTAMRLTLGSMAALLAGDVVFALAELGAGPLSPDSTFLGIPYGLAFVLFGAAALHPSMRTITEKVQDSEIRTTNLRLVVVAVLLGAPGIVLAIAPRASSADRLVLTSATVALTLAGGVRVVRALRERSRAEERLAALASIDRLTGLPNRAALTEHLTDRLSASSGRSGVEPENVVGVLFIDLDQFKMVNDSLGHGAGDQLLMAVADRIRGALTSDDVVFRLGGDEFVVVCHHATTERLVTMGEELRTSFLSPVVVGARQFQVSVSIGVATSVAGSDADADSLLADADIAMYRAKDAGRNTVAVFDDSLRRRLETRVLIEQQLRGAIERGEMAVHYQPIVDALDGRVVAVEALCRWTNPVLGSVSPATFIPLAEETGAIVELGAWVLDQACERLRGWRAIDAASDLRVTVNLSPRQLGHPALLSTVLACLDRHAVPADSLVLEVTEGVLLRGVASERQVLAALRSAGVRLALDDFGTGYSSLSYLQRFPVDCIKVDRAFVVDLDDDANDGALVSAIAAMAQAFGAALVAEGVETQQQADRLVALGIDHAQGYLFHRPVPGEMVSALLSGDAAPLAEVG